MKKLVSKIKVPIDSLKETSWSTIILFSVLYCVNVAFLNLVVFKSNILQPISEATLGIINRTLTVNIASVIVFVFIIIFMFGRLGLIDIGFKKNRLLSAAAATVVIWVSLQLLNIVFGLIISGKPILNSDWNTYGVTRMIGSIIGQLFGNCLLEEIAFRGFLLVQISKKLGGSKGKLFTAVILSQLLFALIHIPNRIMGGMNILEVIPSLVLVLIIGVLFAAIYLLTDNIFLSIGIHALWNTPVLIFTGLPGMLVVFIAIIILLIFWDRSFGKLDSRQDNSLGIQQS